MPNGFRLLRQLRPTPMRPRRPTTRTSPVASPEMEAPELETPEGIASNSATYIVQAAGMSDNDDDSEVFGIERFIPDVPAPVRRPRPNEEYWDSCNIDSE